MKLHRLIIAYVSMVALSCLTAIAVTTPLAYTVFTSDPNHLNDVSGVFVNDTTGPNKQSYLALYLQKLSTGISSVGVNFSGTPTTLDSIGFEEDNKYTTNVYTTSPRFEVTDTKGNLYKFTVSDLRGNAGTNIANYGGSPFNLYGCNIPGKIPVGNYTTSKTEPKYGTNPIASVRFVQDMKGNGMYGPIFLNNTAATPTLPNKG